MVIQNNWSLQFALRIEVDEESDIAMFIEMVLERVRSGESDGRGNHCAGVYEFSTVEWETQQMDNRLLNTIKTAGDLKEVVDEYAVALLAFYDDAIIDFTAANNAIIDRFGRDACEHVKREAKRIANG